MLIGYDKGLATFDNVIQNFLTSFTNLIFYLSSATSYFYLLSLVCIGIGSFVLFVVVSSVVVFSCRARDKCHFFGCMTNFCIAFQGFSACLLTVVVIVFLGVNFAIASICDFSYDLSVKPSVADEVKEYFQSNLKGLLNSECFEASGLKLFEYIDLNDPGLSENFASIGVFLDGFSHYDNFLRLVDPDSFNNNIVAVSDQWETFRAGSLPNFSNVDGTP